MMVYRIEMDIIGDNSFHAKYQPNVVFRIVIST